MSMMGELAYFLGLQVKQLKHGTFLNQSKYCFDLLKKFKMKDCKEAATPIGINCIITNTKNSFNVRYFRPLTSVRRYPTSGPKAADVNFRAKWNQKT